MRPIFYDTETTGVRAEKDRIIELAAYDPVNNKTFEKLIHPQCEIPKEATAIHHISDEMVKDAPPFSEIIAEWHEFCSGEVVLIAHNNDNFDKHFLRHEYQRASQQMPEWKYFDTLKWARRYRPDLPRHTLQFLREIYGIAANNAHRALDDVIVLHKVFCHMTDDIPMKTLYELLNKQKKVQHMPFGKHQGVPLSKVPKNYLKWLKEQGALDKPENGELKVSLEALALI